MSRRTEELKGSRPGRGFSPSPAEKLKGSRFRESSSPSVHHPPLGRRLALRPGEAAKALGISDRTLRTWMRDEGLPYARVGGAVLIPCAQLEAWMAARTDHEQRASALAEEILDDLSKSA